MRSQTSIAATGGMKKLAYQKLASSMDVLDLCHKLSLHPMGGESASHGRPDTAHTPIHGWEKQKRKEVHANGSTEVPPSTSEFQSTQSPLHFIPEVEAARGQKGTLSVVAL